MLRRQLSLTEVVKVPYSEWVAWGWGMSGGTCLGVLYAGTERDLNLPETPSNPSSAAVTVPREICLAGDFSNTAVSVSCCLVTNCPNLDVLKQLVCIIGNECTIQLNGSSGPAGFLDMSVVCCQSGKQLC